MLMGYDRAVVQRLPPGVQNLTLNIYVLERETIKLVKDEFSCGLDLL